jgi:hypothetical protein
MTTAPTENSKTHGLSTAFPAGPWTGRTLDQSETVVSRWCAAHERKRTADAEFKQADADLKYAESQGLLKHHFNDLSNSYKFKKQGVIFSKTSRQSWPIGNFSEQLQTQFEQEKNDGTATPNVSEYLRAKFLDD